MAKQVLAVPARPVLQMIFVTSAWVFTCIASIFQTNVAFAPRKGIRIKDLWVDASLFQKPLKRGRHKLMSLHSDASSSICFDLSQFCSYVFLQF